MMVGLSAALYMVARALPRLSDTDVTPDRPIAPSWVTEKFEQADEWILSFMEKTLRKFRVSLLKLDNMLMSKLKHIKKDTPKEAVFASEIKKESEESLESETLSE